MDWGAPGPPYAQPFMETPRHAGEAWRDPRHGPDWPGDLAVVLDRGAHASESEGPDLFEVERRLAGTSWLALFQVGEGRLVDDITERLRSGSLFAGDFGVGNIGSLFVPVALVLDRTGTVLLRAFAGKIEGEFDFPHPLPAQHEHCTHTKLIGDAGQGDAPVSTMTLVLCGWIWTRMDTT